MYCNAAVVVGIAALSMPALISTLTMLPSLVTSGAIVKIKCSYFFGQKYMKKTIYLEHLKKTKYTPKNTPFNSIKKNFVVSAFN